MIISAVPKSMTVQRTKNDILPVTILLTLKEIHKHNVELITFQIVTFQCHPLIENTEIN